MRIHGYEAIKLVEEFPGIGMLNKHTDPYEEALFDLDIGYAYEVACEDESLIYLDVVAEA